MKKVKKVKEEEVVEERRQDKCWRYKQKSIKIYFRFLVESLSLFRPYISHKFVGFGRANLTRDILPFGRTVHEYVSECARVKIAFVSS